MAYSLTLKQLSVFRAVASYSTLSEAAEHLFLSKAAVSIALSSLEENLGHPLFDRVNNRLLLNQDGQRLLPLVDELLNRADHVASFLDQDEGLSGLLRIGASDTLGNQILPFMLSAFRQQFQHNDQTLLISNSEDICEQVASFQLDIGVIEGTSHHGDLQVTPFIKDHMCVICAPDHTLAKVTNLQWQSFNGQPWILREDGSGSRAFFIDEVSPHLPQWQEVIALNTTEAIINSVSAGLGLACLSELAARAAVASGRVHQLALPKQVFRQCSLVVHKHKYINPLLSAFMQFCHDWKAGNAT